MARNINDLDILTEEVLIRLPRFLKIPVEASGRHVHLKREHVDLLFGKGYELTPRRDLSQPGQYLCEERLTLKTDKGILRNVAILGPVRKDTQVELSLTDAMSIGVDAPVKESGDIKGSASITIISDLGEVNIREGVIVAMRHLHTTPKDAVLLSVKDQDLISIRIDGLRPVIFEDVLVRVNEKYSTAVHIDYDEANACGYIPGTTASIVK
ncbi:MAG: phosphate propanoyltransferase [Synergistaceae bacterium]|nr:phosphate propanoyltransferase [Synergistaceae bacterium]NLW61744.1 phosphate propanoyltransferase [Synergistaceae bacterium]